MGKKIRSDLEGRIFGKLTVINYSHTLKKKKHYTAFWNCKCECGNETIVCSQSLLHNHTRSCGCLSKLPDNQSTWNTLYNDYKRRAEKKKIVFELTMEEFKELCKSDCFYCGSEPKNFKQISKNGIDRVDSREGYTIQNSVSCCSDCNYAKNDMDYASFMSLIERIYLHQKGI